MSCALDHVDIAIIGGGVIGLATAFKITSHPALKNHSLVLLEKHATVGQETSSRNSEVIHAGIYYSQGSLKAMLCLEGREQVYHYCRSRDIPHRRLGKLIIAGKEQEKALAAIAERASNNGVSDLESLDAAHIRQLEPALNSHLALLSPSSGIIDSHAYMQSLLAEAQRDGLLFSPLTRVTGVERQDDGYLVDTLCQDTPYRFRCTQLVNAAGLQAQEVASNITGFPPDAIPARELVKGNYFAMPGPSPFNHLIYPVPEPGLKGLGVHVTLDMAGQTRFGPDTETVTTLDYDVDAGREELFRQAIRQYFPTIDDHKLEPAYSGIRPKLSTDSSVADFVIQSGDNLGYEGLVQLFGIESPGLTASLAIADNVVAMLTA